MTGLYIFWFCVGAIIGSFLNVLGLRLLRDESPVVPSSYCYHCQGAIAWYDNIPILSWLVLGGRCRRCKGPISVQYPLVELLTGVLFVATIAKFGMTLTAAFILFLVANFMVILITDFREQYIFDINSVGLIPFGLVFNGLNLGHALADVALPVGYGTITLPGALVSAVLAVVAAYVLFYVLNLFSRITLGKQGFGEGDARLLMGIGAFFGLRRMAIIFVLSFVIQAVVGIPMLMFQWYRQKAYGILGLFGLGVILALLPYGVQLVGVEGDILLLVALGAGVGAMVCVMKAMKMAKELPAGLTYLPFGPAIVMAGLLFIFFTDAVASLFRSYIPL